METQCYIIYKVLQIKINQLLRKKKIQVFLVLREIPPLEQFLNNLHLAVIFKAMRKKKTDKSQLYHYLLIPFQNKLF